ncbi:MAG TPA: diguanylate cyclase [Solirubrobacteraceae bacterium]|nr:diguanylate cyclase [Solirubrobacteraceae bacterium]
MSTSTHTDAEGAQSREPVGRLQEETWHSRSRRTGRRELIVDTAAAALFLCAAVPLALVGRQPASILLVLPLGGLLLIVWRGRSAHIAEARRRLDLVAHERTRLQTAVWRLGDALAARLDLASLTDIVLRGSIEALDADAGCLTLRGPPEPRVIELASDADALPALRAAALSAETRAHACQLQHGDAWALALPFGFSSDLGDVSGAVAVARLARPFREDERAVMSRLVERARQAACDIVMRELLREQALTDPLTQLGNRRKLAADLEQRLAGASPTSPLALALFDLDGFKSYNDTFGHPAGDAMLARLGAKLASAVAPYGTAYRLGGDEFCVLLAADSADVRAAIELAVAALSESGENFSVGCSHGAALLPEEAEDLDRAIRIADQRMYALKKGRQPPARDQTRDVLMRIIHAKAPSLQVHSSEVAELCVRIGRRLGMSGEQLDELARAAELHDIGKVGIPDEILEKPGPLTVTEWEFMRQHTVLGERILSAAPALRPVAAIVGATHERWDGRGYPDGLAAAEIPLGARVIAACDAYEAMTSERPYSAAVEHRAACAELRREAGRQFDPEVVDVLLAEIDAAPAPPAPASAHARRERAPAVR